MKLKSKQSCLCAGHAFQGEKICVPSGNNNSVSVEERQNREFVLCASIVLQVVWY